MNQINLDTPPIQVSALSGSQLLFYTEACIDLLEKQGHRPGALLFVEGEADQQVRLIWSGKSAKSKLRELRDLAEFGSIALAVYLVESFSEYRVVEQSVIGTGFDYWLGYKEGNALFDPDNFLNARLEVSGIAKGERRDARKRLSEKMRQLEVSDHLKIPALIIIIEFSKPISIIFAK